MEKDARGWVERRAEAFLRKAGLAEGDAVLDFGCNKGQFATAAARVVGDGGTVYALDKDADALADVCGTSNGHKRPNVECLHVAEDGNIPLPPCSVDVVLAYDVLHRGYFPERARRMETLRRIHRVLKGGGVLSFYPTHLKKYGMTFERTLSEVETVGFALKGAVRRRLVHDGRLTRGRVFSYRKRGTCGRDG